MSRPTAIKSIFLDGIDKLIDILQDGAGGEAEKDRGPSRGDRRTPTQRPPSDLTLLITRLTQIRDWLQKDPLMVELIDRYIGNQVQKQARKTLWLSVLWTIAGAVLGWLLSSLGTPETIWHLFLRT